MSMTLGSLFDGSGGFPLAGSMCGFKPLWASEIEPYPIAVTRSRFPDMQHLGDISKIDGGKIPPVDIITFGSPCQDLSVAGKRAGLKHEGHGDEETTRSGLFMEAVRIIKEMRKATDDNYPRFALWENVPGAFSSNKGEDFRVVLEELIKIVEPDAVMPDVPEKGWAYADSFRGDGWSLSYRVFDTQYWPRTPQRRKRIYLAADFGGQCAGEILFEREGLRGDYATGRAPWEDVATGTESGIRGDDQAVTYGVVTKGNGDCFLSKERHTSLSTGGGQAGQGYPCVMQPIAYESHPQEGTADTPIICMATQQGGAEITENGVCPTITAAAGMSGNNQPWICWPQKAHTLSARHDGSPQPDKGNGANIIVQAAGFKAGQGVNARSIGYEEERTPTIAAEAGGNSIPSVCITEALPFDTTQVTSPQNGCHPKWGDPCHPLASQAHAPSVVAAVYDARGNGDGQIVSTITGDHNGHISDYTAVVVEPAYSIQGNTVDREAKQNGMGVSKDVAHTLNATDRHVTAFSMQSFGDYKESDQASGLKARDYKDATDLVIEQNGFQNTGQGWWNDEEIAATLRTPCGGDSTKANVIVSREEVFGVDCRNMNEYPELYPTLQAKPNGGQSLNFSGAVRVRYIVRRLTPTECARLQGFADRWGDIDLKEDFTDEEYRFWLDVRNTHATINGKMVKDYTKAQMLKWYNKLGTDSAEYKMWGNGLALPPTLYVMQGIYDVAKKNTAA